MPHRKVNTLGDLRNLKIKLRDSVQITKAGGFYRARLHGRKNSVFGRTAEEARQRLLGTSAGTICDSSFNAQTRLRNAYLEALR